MELRRVILMSQAKVDQYKKEKANRKQTVAREKVKRIITKVCASVIGLALAAWIVVSGVFFVIDNRPVKTFFVKSDALEEYLDELYEEETEESTELLISRESPRSQRALAHTSW